MMVSFKGIGQWCATFMGAQLQEGSVVKVGGSGEAVACENGEAFVGCVICSDGEAATVQVGGFAEVGYTGEVMLGYVGLSADGNGGVKADENGEKHWVVSKDENAQRMMILL